MHFGPHEIYPMYSVSLRSLPPRCVPFFVSRCSQYSSIFSWYTWSSLATASIFPLGFCKASVRPTGTFISFEWAQSTAFRLYYFKVNIEHRALGFVFVLNFLTSALQAVYVWFRHRIKINECNATCGFWHRCSRTPWSWAPTWENHNGVLFTQSSHDRWDNNNRNSSSSSNNNNNTHDDVLLSSTAQTICDSSLWVFWAKVGQHQVTVNS